MVKYLKWVGIITGIILLAAVGFFFLGNFTIGYTPSYNKIINADLVYTDSGRPEEAYDVWGDAVSEKEAEELLQTEEGRAYLSEENGAVQVDEEILDLGRKSFYEETFGNEVFLTDVMGILDGPLSIYDFMKAIVKLAGNPTDNLQVELPKTVTIGGITLEKGTMIDTGLDVPRGAVMPLGMPITVDRGRVKAGISCALCHASVDMKNNGNVVEGATNTDLNTGTLMALASNSASYFTHTDVENLENYVEDVHRSVETTKGETEPLPDIEALETAVDETLMKWPPGFFDATIDMEANPTQVSDSFTFGDHPYSWSGMGMAGTFRGLTTLNNNVQAQGADAIAQSQISEELLDIDPEVYLGTLLQNAANENFRYDPESDQLPSEFFAGVDPHPGQPGVNETVKLPTFPDVSIISPQGYVASSPGRGVNEQNNSMSAFQNTLVPPKPHREADESTLARGREVFHEGGCVSCHAGRFKTNNLIIPVDDIGTQPSRAKALEATEKVWDEPLIYSPDTPVPVPEDATIIKAPTDHIEEKQKDLGFAHGKSQGGYKVKGLAGVYWQAPYLHDGGVAVGPNKNKDIGIPGTLLQGIRPDPYNSMLAIVDRQLRQQVIEANRSSQDLQDINIEGIGHEFWIDEEAGFSEEDQEALIDYVLSLTGEREEE
ncbi:electron transport protein [Bacillus sp. FJAT-44742]|uniref:electron transport protein n=1 Tax=Bacillus sp. FJAT-44742 TaxID=2014005 RepID=UPI0018E22216|nr:electron transport protein [Bacillus sp. FJAT-44742]